MSNKTLLKQIIPMLPVKNMPASVGFYRKLGFEVVKQMDAWGWARMKMDGCELMLDQSLYGHYLTPRSGVLYFYPEDVRQYHAQVKANGLQISELEVTFYGMLEFRMEDPDGNRIWIGAQTS